MKQHITQEQWNELSEKQKLRLYQFIAKDLINISDVSETIDKIVVTPDIGEMIEFLGEKQDASDEEKSMKRMNKCCEHNLIILELERVEKRLEVAENKHYFWRNSTVGNTPGEQELKCLEEKIGNLIARKQILLHRLGWEY